jgi:riboflavin kinase/FMN adenylyltransferase
MLIFSSLDHTAVDGAWLTIGSYDGVHRGHQEIIRRLVAEAHVNAAPAVVLTFFPHPSIVLRGTNGPFYLTSPEERAVLLGNLGVDIVIIQQFDRQLANTSARDFVIRLKDRLGMRRLFVGHDFTLGRNREGNIAALAQLGKELDYQVVTQPPVLLDRQVISSSQIRAALSAGNVTTAHRLLGRPYRISGKIIPGDGRGRTIGIPTANLEIWKEQLLPATGVYVCRAVVNEKTYGAATNIGVRPTFDGATHIQHVESHLLDFDGDLYGQQLQLDFIGRLRGEQKFPSVQTLIAQIRSDISEARQILAQANP